MKLGVALLAVLASLVFVVPAEGYYILRYGQAKNHTRVYSKEVCQTVQGCTAWGVGRCERLATRRFRCLYANWHRPSYVDEEEIECQQVLHWGVRRGYVALVGKGRVRCY